MLEYAPETNEDKVSYSRKHREPLMRFQLTTDQ